MHFGETIVQNFKTSGTICVGDFLYIDGRTKGKLRSMAKLKYVPKRIIGRAISEVDKDMWSVILNNGK